MTEGLKFANLALAFALELCMLAALAFWGMHTGTNLALKIGLAVGAPLLAAVLWGIFMAPQAALAVPEPWYLLLTLAFYGVAIAALASAGQARLGWVFAALVALNLMLAAVWHQ